jgi:hypothetical protein
LIVSSLTILDQLERRHCKDKLLAILHRGVKWTA